MRITITILAIMIILCGCSQTEKPAINLPEENLSDAVENVPVETPTLTNNDDYAVIETSPPESLSIDMDKINLLLGFNPENNRIDDIGVLRKKYPDLVLTSSEYLGNHNNIYDATKDEMWHSDKNGMSYRVIIDPMTEGFRSNIVIENYSTAENLIIGLNVPITTEEAMSLLDIPDSDWAIGEAPEGSGYAYYKPGYFDEISPDSICFILLYSHGKYGLDAPIGIIITPSKPGYIFPSDILRIFDVEGGE